MQALVCQRCDQQTEMRQQRYRHCGLRIGDFGLKTPQSEIRNPKSEICGLSLLELLIVISLSGLFMGAVQELLVTGLRVVDSADDRESIRQRLAYVVDRFTREMSLCTDVDVAQDGGFQFDADINGDGSDENNINYQYTSGTLTRTYSGTTVTLISGLTAFDLNYVDDTGAQLTTPVAGSQEDDIRVVHISATVASGNETFSLESASYLRNM